MVRYGRKRRLRPGEQLVRVDERRVPQPKTGKHTAKVETKGLVPSAAAQQGRREMGD